MVVIRSALLPRLPDMAALIPASSTGLVDKDGLRFICWLPLPFILEVKMPAGQDFIGDAVIDTGPVIVEASIYRGDAMLESDMATGGVTVRSAINTGPVIMESKL